MSDRAVIDAVLKITGLHNADRVYIAACEVQSVDLSKRQCTCTLIDGETENEISVDLMAAIDDGFLIEPSEGSTVKVVFSDFASPFICQYSEIENFYIVAKATINIDANSIVFNGGNNDGLVKVKDLITSLNRIENKLNDLISKYNTHTHILTLSSGTGTAAATTTTETTVQTTQQSDIENTDIKQ